MPPKSPRRAPEAAGFPLEAKKITNNIEKHLFFAEFHEKSILCCQEPSKTPNGVPKGPQKRPKSPPPK